MFRKIFTPILLDFLKTRATASLGMLAGTLPRGYNSDNSSFRSPPQNIAQKTNTPVYERKEIALLRQEQKRIDIQALINDKFIKQLKELGANDYIIDLVRANSDKFVRILNSDFVQKMADNTLTYEEFINDFIYPDMLYVYHMGEALKEEAAKDQSLLANTGIDTHVGMFDGYKEKIEKIKRTYRIPDLAFEHAPELDVNRYELNEPFVKEHLDNLKSLNTPSKYNGYIIGDMLPFLLIGLYLDSNLSKDDRWHEYKERRIRPQMLEVIKNAFSNIQGHELHKNDFEKHFKHTLDFESKFINKVICKDGGLTDSLCRNYTSRDGR